MNKAKRWINPAIQSLQAYHVPAAKGLIKLDAMENPFPWPDKLIRQWLAEIRSVPVNRYPDPGATSLSDKLRSIMQVPADLSIMVGNGSDEIIQILALALAQPDRIYLSVEPGFVMYRQVCLAVNTRYVAVPLNGDNFSLDHATIIGAIQQYQPALVFIASPNNPTGNLFDEEILLDIIRNAPGPVIIDEAYHAFSGKTLLGYVNQFDNLLILRTLSKSGLAGLRLGYLIGKSCWLDELEKIRLPYNINSLSQQTGNFILRHYKLLEDQVRKICLERDYMYEELSAIEGIRTWPSRANFILFRATSRNADELFNDLVQRGILIKNLHKTHPLLENCLRVTIGTEKENRIFLDTIRSLAQIPIS